MSALNDFAKGDYNGGKSLDHTEIQENRHQGRIQVSYGAAIPCDGTAWLRLRGDSFCADDPHKVLVVSTWINRKRWKEWRTSEKRKEYTKKIEPLLEEPENYEVFIAGEKEPEWVDMA